jgi:hypothetical protein
VGRAWYRVRLDHAASCTRGRLDVLFWISTYRGQPSALFTVARSTSPASMRLSG